MRTGAVIAAAVPFVWLGMVLAISFLEAPPKFRAPGITVPLGLGIGRLVLHALNAAELALAAVLLVAGVVIGMPSGAWVQFGGVAALLAVQVLVLRPRLDRRAVAILAGQSISRSHHHLAYIALEVAKVLVLVSLGVGLATQVPS